MQRAGQLKTPGLDHLERILALLGLLLAPYSRQTQAGLSLPSNQAVATTSASSSPGATNAVAEWYGPFPSWGNVRNAPYNAFGDGVHDDTGPISNALANVGLGTLRE